MRNFQEPSRSVTMSKNGMVATSHPLAAKVGLDILEQGGNAVDSALAMAFMLPICEPHSTGFFGDAFALINEKGSNKIHGFNGSGAAPKNINADIIRRQGNTAVPENNVSAVTLPGAVALFDKLMEDFGTLGLSAVCNPAIRYADEGVVVAPRVGFDWFKSSGHLKGDATKFYLDGGKPFRAGKVFRAAGQARVLEKISELGSKGFYEGEIAEDMITSLRALGGTHSLDEFALIKPEKVEPLSCQFQKFNLVELPPNGQGIVAFLMRKILDNFGLGNVDPRGAVRVHLEAEATKLAYDMRNRFVADPNMAKVDITEFLNEKTVLQLAEKINPKRASQVIYSGLSSAEHKDTVYITAVDKDRCSVSLIFSIFNSFGTGLASKKYGLLFHNRGAGFNLDLGHPNELEGGKRPLHTIIPGMIKENGKVTMPFGVMGGQYQANGHVRFISNVYDYGMDVQTAIDFPRSFAEKGTLSLELGYSEKIASELEDMGHTVVRPNIPIGGAQAVQIDYVDGVLKGGSDPRKDGLALGY